MLTIATAANTATRGISRSVPRTSGMHVCLMYMCERRPPALVVVLQVGRTHEAKDHSRGRLPLHRPGHAAEALHRELEDEGVVPQVPRVCVVSSPSLCSRLNRVLYPSLIIATGQALSLSLRLSESQCGPLSEHTLSMLSSAQS